jgi:hypothetical protein
VTTGGERPKAAGLLSNFEIGSHYFSQAPDAPHQAFLFQRQAWPLASVNYLLMTSRVGLKAPSPKASQCRL